MIQVNEELKIYHPLKYKPRKEQIQMLEFAKNSINSGNKFILLDSPTGIGKSYFVMMFMNWYKNYINPDAKCDIITETKILESQYVKDFEFISDLRGKSNYACEPYDTNCEKGMEICKVFKKNCPDCPHKIAKEGWKRSQISLTNFHLFNAFAIYTNEIIERKSNVLIIDEAHSFESVFCDFITTYLSARILKKCGFPESEVQDYDEYLKRPTDIDRYASFIETQLLPDLEKLTVSHTETMSNTTNKGIIAQMSEYLINIENCHRKFSKVSQSFREDPKNWVLEINKNEKPEAHDAKKKVQQYSNIVFELKPIWVNEYLPKLWSMYDHIILMSGTILDKNLFTKINGIDEEVASYFKMQSPFKLKNRPVFYIKAGKMTYNEKKETFKKQIEIINKILERNKDNKGIIHTATYEFATWISEKIFNKRFIFHTSEDRELALENHINSKKPSVLISPSMHTGVSLDDELSRFQIIIKIPYPNISSEKVKARQKTNKDWYGYQTCVDIIQSYGRSIRNENDYAETYILDSSFSDILAYNSRWLPDWFTRAVKVLS